MVAFSKSSAVDRERRFNAIYLEFIAETSDFLSCCEKTAILLNARLPSGCYTNFRDALFHFRRLVKSTEENEIQRQSFAIEEHTKRVKTDAIVCILEYCTYILQILTHEEFGLSEEEIKALTLVKKDIDNNILYLRLSGIMLDQAGMLRISDSEFEELMERFFAFIDTYVHKEKYRKAIEKLIMKQPLV